MVEENADSIMKLKGDTAVSKLGLFQFNQYVEDLMVHYTREELESIAIVADMFDITGMEKNMTKTQLATHIAEEKSLIELQKQKLGPYLKEKNQQTQVYNLQKDDLGSVPIGKEEDQALGTGTPGNRKLQRLIGATGNATEVVVQRINPLKKRGIQITLGKQLCLKDMVLMSFCQKKIRKLDTIEVFLIELKKKKSLLKRLLTDTTLFLKFKKEGCQEERCERKKKNLYNKKEGVAQSFLV